MPRKTIEILPSHSECYVCKKTVPMSELQDCGLGVYRCKKHRGSTILKAGQERAGRKWIISGEITATFRLEIEEIRG